MRNLPRPRTAARATHVALLFIFCLTLGSETGCERAATPPESTRQFTMRGIIRSATPDHRTLEIEHETIPDFMPAMTMPVTVLDPKTTAELKVGDAISCRLTVSRKEASIDNIVKIKAEDLQLGSPTPAPSLQPASSP